MSEALSFAHLGFRHIVDVTALDHILFLLALAAIYRGRDWRDSLWVISAFTVGHSMTLALVATGTLHLSNRLVEVLIPLTIVATGLENIVVPERARAPLGRHYRPIFAAVFGLVHGAGFANYLQSLFTGSIVIPLVGFNLGIELGQILVLTGAMLLLTTLDRLLGSLLDSRPQFSPFRLRVVSVSAAVVLSAAWMTATRFGP
jgi:hypothetical protein